MVKRRKENYPDGEKSGGIELSGMRKRLEKTGGEFLRWEKDGRGTVRGGKRWERSCPS